MSLQIVINGTSREFDADRISYDDLVRTTGIPEPYISYQLGQAKASGVLVPGQSVHVVNGMVFSVINTGAA